MYSLYIKEEILRFSQDFRDFIYSVGKVMSGSPGLMDFAYKLLPATHEITYLLRLVFTSDGVVVGVAIRRVERYDLVKIKPTESEAEH